MYHAHSLSPLGSVGSTVAMKCRSDLLGSRVLTGGRGRKDRVGVGVEDGAFPGVLPKEVLKIKDPFARRLAQRMERLPVESEYHDRCIMSSCVKPLVQREEAKPVVLLHSFDSSLLEWRCAYPLLESAGLEAWSVDILGWGFSDLERNCLHVMQNPSGTPLLSVLEVVCREADDISGTRPRCLISH